MTTTGIVDAAIWCEEAGDATRPLIALVHGSMDRSAGMLRLSRRLDRRFRVLRYDRRGYGRSTPHAGPFDVASQVVDLFGLIGGRQALVVGHSFGGNIALAAAAARPDLVRGVAVYETPLSWQRWWPTTTAGSQAVQAPEPASEAAERFMRRLVGDAKWESLPDKTRAARRGEGAALVGELSDLRLNPPWVPEDVVVPVVLGFGSRGAPHHQRAMRDAAAEIRGATVVELAGCGHGAPMSDADLFASMTVEPLIEAVGPPWSQW
ncbi:MAG: alpha/beta hydrolase [Ilumatobacteraceae bacterium]